MKPGPILLLIATLAMLLGTAVPDAAAQGGGLKSGKKDRKDKRNSPYKPDPRDYRNKPRDLVAWGTTVTGRAPKDITKTVNFWTVEGTRVTLRLRCKNAKRDVRAFAYFGTIGRAELKPQEKDPTLFLLEDLEVSETGYLSVEVLCGSKLGCSFTLETAADFPETLTRKIKLDRDDVEEIFLPGAMGRKAARIEFVPPKGGRLYVTLRSPEGRLLKIVERLPTVRGVASISNINLGSDGIYFLELYDRSGLGGDVQMKVTFTNPKPFKGTKKL